jgi:hypothetical protein
MKNIKDPPKKIGQVIVVGDDSDEHCRRAGDGCYRVGDVAHCLCRHERIYKRRRAC